MARIADDITQLVGMTPLVRLKRIGRGLQADIVAKLESFNPCSSVLDRIGLSIIEAAERDGKIGRDSVYPGAYKRQHRDSARVRMSCSGDRLILTMPDTMSVERRQLLKALGAELILTPGAGGYARRNPLSRRAGCVQPAILHAAAVQEPCQPGGSCADHGRGGLAGHRQSSGHLRGGSWNRWYDHWCQRGDKVAIIGGNV